jgi:hypothetical protein
MEQKHGQQLKMNRRNCSYLNGKIRGKFAAQLKTRITGGSEQTQN